MKLFVRNNRYGTFTLILAIFFCSVAIGQTTKKDRRLVEDSQDARKDFIHTDSLMRGLFSSAYGYAIFPIIGKGAIGVGGAAGNGIVFQKDSAMGKTFMNQLTIGFQLGGQSYREVIFFQDKETLDRFKASNVEFSAQVSAVAAKQGAAANVKYANGVMVFTQEKGGLMFEASVGGQKFKYSEFDK
jgi:lipid-binding SYLF domain-containing protein